MFYIRDIDLYTAASQFLVGDTIQEILKQDLCFNTKAQLWSEQTIFVGIIR